MFYFSWKWSSPSSFLLNDILSLLNIFNIKNFKFLLNDDCPYLYKPFSNSCQLKLSGNKVKFKSIPLQINIFFSVPKYLLSVFDMETGLTTFKNVCSLSLLYILVAYPFCIDWGVRSAWKFDVYYGDHLLRFQCFLLDTFRHIVWK